VDTQAVAAWLDGYSQAWGTYDPERIGALFSEDAVYYYDPFSDPVQGREAIVADWLKDRDEAGTYEGRYRPVLVAGDQAVARATAATSTPTAACATSTTTCSCSASTPTGTAPSTASGICPSPSRAADREVRGSSLAPRWTPATGLQPGRTPWPRAPIA
jgi:uncharacterized protein (TIGR02246 family)